MITCANKHDVVLSVRSTDSVHGNLSEAVVHVSSDEDGPSAHGVDGVVHQRVVTCKLDHIVWEALCGFKASECLAWTLSRKMIQFIFQERLSVVYAFFILLKES